MKKFLSMLTLVAILGGTTIGCTGEDKDKKKVDTKVNADKSSTTKEEKKTTTPP